MNRSGLLIGVAEDSGKMISVSGRVGLWRFVTGNCISDNIGEKGVRYVWFDSGYGGVTGVAFDSGKGYY